MDKDLLGFRCEFVPGMITPRTQSASRCRPVDSADLNHCPGSENCKKPEACRVENINRWRSGCSQKR